MKGSLALKLVIAFLLGAAVWAGLRSTVVPPPRPSWPPPQTALPLTAEASHVNVAFACSDSVVFRVTPWSIEVPKRTSVAWHLAGASALRITHDSLSPWPFEKQTPSGDSVASTGPMTDTTVAVGTRINYRINAECMIGERRDTVVVDPELIITPPKDTVTH